MCPCSLYPKQERVSRVHEVEVRSLDEYKRVVGSELITKLQQVHLRLKEPGLHRASELLDARLPAGQHVQITYLSILGDLLEAGLTER